MSQALQEALWRSAYQNDIAEMLLCVSKGVKPNDLDEFNNNALHFAVQHGGYEAASMLIENGANVNQQNKIGSTPLHRAAREGHELCAKLLIEHGANLDVQSADGNTPIHIAAFRAQPKLVQILLAAGANTTLKNEEGKVPEQMAEDPSVAAIFKGSTPGAPAASTPKGAAATATKQPTTAATPKAKPAESKPAESKPAAQASSPRPAESKPAESKPAAQAKPAATAKPAESKPAAASSPRPAETKPAAAAAKPAESKPAAPPLATSATPGEPSSSTPKKRPEVETQYQALVTTLNKILDKNSPDKQIALDTRSGVDEIKKMVGLAKPGQPDDAAALEKTQASLVLAVKGLMTAKAKNEPTDGPYTTLQNSLDSIKQLANCIH